MTESTRNREISLSSTVNGPKEMVFEAFSQVEHLSNWWGPNGFTTTTLSFDFRPGGVWDFIMHGPDGQDWPNWIQYLEIDQPDRLVFRHGEHSDDPESFLSTVTIVEHDGKSEITLRTLFNTSEQRDRAVEQIGAIEGGKQTLARLADFVGSRTPAR